MENVMGGHFDTILFIMILVIFGFTAVLSLGSIPDWIKIPEWYKKKLFLVLIVEVVAIVLTSGNALFNGDKKTTVVEKKRDKNEELTPLPDPLKQYIYVLDGTDTLGKIAAAHKNLVKADIFNYIHQPASDYGDYKSIKWTFRNNSKWSDPGKSQPYIKGCPYYVTVEGKGENSRYRIYKVGEEEPVYCSVRDDQGEDMFNLNSRRVHLFEYQDTETKETYYTLFRMLEMNFKPENPEILPFVHFLQLRIRPVLQEKRM